MSVIRRVLSPKERHGPITAIPVVLALIAGGVAFATLARVLWWRSILPLTLPYSEQPNAWTDGVALPGQPASLSLGFEPTGVSRVVTLIFYRDVERRSFDALRISPDPRKPSAWFASENGRMASLDPLGDEAGDSARDVELTFSANGVQVRINGVDAGTRPMALHTEQMFVMVEPGMKFALWRSPYSAIRRLDVVGTDGAEKSLVPAPWLMNLVVIPAAFLGILLVWLIDGLAAWIFGWRPEGSKFAYRIGRLYPWLPLAIPIAAGAIEFVFPSGVDHGLYAPYIREGVFDWRSFKQTQTLQRPDRDIVFRLERREDLVLVFGGGGSMNLTEPLQTRLDGTTALGGYRFKVVNLSEEKAGLSELMPPGLSAFFLGVKPRIVVIHYLLKDFVDARDMPGIVHDLGFYSVEFGDKRDSLDSFRAQITEVVTMASKTGALPVYVDEAIDESVFGRDPAKYWRLAARDAAREAGAVVVPGQEIADDGREPWYFANYDRPSAYGADRLARAIVTQVVGARERLLPPLIAVSDSVEP